MKKILLLFILISSQLLYSQSDCSSAIPVCGNSTLSYTPSGPGSTLEDLGGCLINDEHFSTWYSFTASTSGTLAFTIDAVNNSTDYDFAVYAANATCANLGAPIRCNYAGASPTGNTGLELSDSGSNYFEANLDVIAGETYYLIVDNFSSTANSGFSLIWEGTAQLSSPFNNPALTPFPFITPGVPNATDPTLPNEILKCALPMQFDFTTLSAGILNGNQNFNVTYHNTVNDAITGDNPLTTTLVNGTTIYYYRLKYQDPANPNNPINSCFVTGRFKFKQGNIVASDATLTACNNNGAGTATFNLTLATVFNDPGSIKKYYPSLADMNANTNQIMNPTAYVSAPKTVYVKVTSFEGCTDDATIALSFYPVVIVNPATLESCYIELAPTTAAFDLTTATVTSQTGITKLFYTTLANATAQTSPIPNPTNYITTSREVYVRVTNTNECWAIAKITLIVLPPVKSTVLKDKTICMEDRTTLDAGAGFLSYEWSTGAKTQIITGVAVGTYWVKLQTGKCFTIQNVNVYPSNQPIISTVDITNNSVTITANGGTPGYQYSINGINWQASNVFSGLPRGENTVYVNDSYDCDPVQVTVTVPNLVNAITPNGDNMNDAVDYSALSYKKNLVFTVYNRYGNKIYVGDKIRNYSWDGTSGGKKIQTGTYWYTITWTEDDKNKTEMKYSGWILVKNRE
ncbi:gliding motility-associated C-terminal domain-containing protein [Chryseobacterium piscicola]|uniref:Chromophore lyase n=1 Tax=Chryseobacterium piscicola TaxID=551459 RepID=A0A1N7KCH5_9FLAO|nr:gliding motility-associated C-terminal domain-containing protein [Chryseobacterium piscicola]PQA96380.1 chromophore lyase [Chryseobacterium piscicola]SIS59296.1 gliding motility-associated C-terminal domain-containing protein [Chryseobacterium piscicola]